MAYELLKGESPIHLCRHDVESLFYIILLICARHTFGYVQNKGEKEKKWQVVTLLAERPYQEWFGERNYKTLGNRKAGFFSDYQPIELSTSFEDFGPWLRALQLQLGQGFLSKASHKYQQLYQQASGGALRTHPIR